LIVGKEFGDNNNKKHFNNVLLLFSSFLSMTERSRIYLETVISELKKVKGYVLNYKTGLGQIIFDKKIIRKIK